MDSKKHLMGDGETRETCQRRASGDNKQEESTVVFALFSALIVTIYSTMSDCYTGRMTKNHSRHMHAPFEKQREERKEELLL